MITWLVSNLGTIVVGGLLLLMVAAILRSLYKDKKAGKRTCGGSCSACGGCTACSPSQGCAGCTPTKK